jgi:hypothetical protein
MKGEICSNYSDINLDFLRSPRIIARLFQQAGNIDVCDFRRDLLQT